MSGQLLDFLRFSCLCGVFILSLYFVLLQFHDLATDNMNYPYTLISDMVKSAETYASLLDALAMYPPYFDLGVHPDWHSDAVWEYVANKSMTMLETTQQAAMDANR